MKYPTLKFFHLQFPAQDSLGLELKKESDEVAIQARLIDQLEKEEQESRGGPSWPNIVHYSEVPLALPINECSEHDACDRHLIGGSAEQRVFPLVVLLSPGVNAAASFRPHQCYHAIAAAVDRVKSAKCEIANNDCVSTVWYNVSAYERACDV
ncbi:hypothetical protein QAD02_017594 [Eretmocerus hayati]|uniref:Uncharacterized protein n=1 Tax=Eretmocerus hayati TaxID=131215 RepID=A0ACC2PEP4_9HYME|nr:hypothetical protein QAD02_017594 [Eretmocerus hayati]